MHEASLIVTFVPTFFNSRLNGYVFKVFKVLTMCSHRVLRASSREMKQYLVGKCVTSGAGVEAERMPKASVVF